MDLVIKSFKVKKRSGSVVRVRWWNLTRENATKLLEKIKSEASWKLIEDVDAMWEGMTQCIRRLAKEVFRVFRGGGGRKNRAWWWDEEVREKVKENKRFKLPLAAVRLRKKEERGRLRRRLQKSQRRRLSLWQRTIL